MGKGRDQLLPLQAISPKSIPVPRDQASTTLAPSSNLSTKLLHHENYTSKTKQYTFCPMHIAVFTELWSGDTGSTTQERAAHCNTKPIRY